MRFLPLFFAIATASFSDCGSRFKIHAYTVDPPGIVGTGQNVTTDATFEIPPGASLTSGRVHIYTTWNHLMATEFSAPLCEYFDCPLLNGTHTWRYRAPFPADVSGRIQTTLRVLNDAGASLLCFRWIAYATGTATNETSWLVRSLYA